MVIYLSSYFLLLLRFLLCFIMIFRACFFVFILLSIPSTSEIYGFTFLLLSVWAKSWLLFLQVLLLPINFSSYSGTYMLGLFTVFCVFLIFFKKIYFLFFSLWMLYYHYYLLMFFRSCL